MSNPRRYDIIEGTDKETGASVFFITAPEDKGEQAVDECGVIKGTRCLYNRHKHRFCVFTYYSDARTVVDELNRLIDEANDAWRQGHIQGSLEPCHYPKKCKDL